jgi:hypothetical protein
LNRSLESALRFVNLTTSGLLAGSLGFGEAALVPGWEAERPCADHHRFDQFVNETTRHYANAIGPVALATAITLALGTRESNATRRTLDAVSAIGLAGVLAATVMVTVPINQALQAEPATDYASDRSGSMVKNWSRAHAVRTTLGIGAFLCAVAANISRKSP